MNSTKPKASENVGYKLEAGALVTFVLVAIAVGLRTFARAKYAKLWWNDSLMVLAAVGIEGPVVDFLASLC